MIDSENDTIPIIQDKIREMIKKNYKGEINTKEIAETKILLFLPGGIPFIVGKISDFKKSFPNYMPHLYAILVNDPTITDKVLDETFDTVCNIKDEKMKRLLSPDVTSEINGLCEIASVLGYIQHNGINTKRMIYSIAKYCPFTPMINGLYCLSTLNRATGRIIIQITAPLIRLFEEMSSNLSNKSNLFASTVKFLTFFMNIDVSYRVPCTEFIRPFYNVGFERYFNQNFPEEKFPQIQYFVAFNPDFRDMDWIRFQLPSLREEDFTEAMKMTKKLIVIPPMELRYMHCIGLFQGKNGPCLFLAESVFNEETDRDKEANINPENGVIENDSYENIIKKFTVDSCKRSLEDNEYSLEDNEYSDHFKGHEYENMLCFMRKDKVIQNPVYLHYSTEKYQENNKNEEEIEEEGYDFSINRHVPRPRRQLSPPSK